MAYINAAGAAAPLRGVFPVHSAAQSENDSTNPRRALETAPAAAPPLTQRPVTQAAAAEPLHNLSPRTSVPAMTAVLLQELRLQQELTNLREVIAQKE